MLNKEGHTKLSDDAVKADFLTVFFFTKKNIYWSTSDILVSSKHHFQTHTFNIKF